MRTDDAPLGWDYNPSEWGQRLPIAGLALLGTAIAVYLSIYQMGVVESVWEPFFGDGATEVLESPLSRVLAIPDAALGAGAYLLDAATAFIGGTDRWRRMPWVVILFGIAVGPLGAVSVLLVVLQPVAYDAFCTLCLTSALVSVLMIGPAMDEVLASLQQVKRARHHGTGVVGSLVHGGTR